MGSFKKKALESGGSKQCKGYKKKKPTKEFLSLRRPNTIIQTCQSCQRPLHYLATKDPNTPAFSAGKQIKKDTEPVRELKKLEFKKNKKQALKKAKQDKNCTRKNNVREAIQILDSKYS